MFLSLSITLMYVLLSVRQRCVTWLCDVPAHTPITRRGRTTSRQAHTRDVRTVNTNRAEPPARSLTSGHATGVNNVLRYTPARRTRREREDVTSQAETFEFQSETRQLLQLMIHSIYSNKDIFLRELISNASDALDKLRIEAFRDKDLDVDTSDLHVEVHIDEEQRTLTVSDNGIGMTRDDVISMIGTIAKSGSAEFIEKLREAQEAGDTQGLIGQFGVGFYSSFMVADRVTMLTRHAGAEQGVRWESTGEGSYTLEDVADAPQGTAVTLHLPPADEENQLAEYTSTRKI